MSKPIIKIENIGKRYRIGGKKEQYLSLRDEVVNRLSNAKRRERTAKEEFWALKDVSFSVEQGEAIGIIGRNGAGKSTLLKVLSQITPPTEGKITMRGRVASLLEVGTGFHPELSGKENIYLNGAILGMSRSEIARKFDEIVAFAEIEKFLDTPVKRYSSGMYVRLAFAVAAHLEPEILVVDEVLAVGDAAFQKKCLGKMSDVSHCGRTVLFVSHNMNAVTSLCARAIQIDGGKVIQDTTAKVAVEKYLADNTGENPEVIWSDEDAPGDEMLQLKAVRVVNQDGIVCSNFGTSESVIVQYEFDLARLDRALTLAAYLRTSDGTWVLNSQHNDLPAELSPKFHIGHNIVECVLPSCLFNAGTYTIDVKIALFYIKWIVNLDSVVKFQLNFTHGDSEYLNDQCRHTEGIILPIIPWRTCELDKR